VHQSAEGDGIEVAVGHDRVGLLAFANAIPGRNEAGPLVEGSATAALLDIGGVVIERLDLQEDRAPLRLLPQAAQDACPVAARAHSIVDREVEQPEHGRAADRVGDSHEGAAVERARDRAAAEALRGVRLLVETDDASDDAMSSEEDDESWYRHELVGLRALSVSGELLGEVTDLEPGVAQDRLVVTTPEGDDVAVPFVAALVPAIDPETGTVTLDPPGGLFPGLGEVEEAR